MINTSSSRRFAWLPFRQSHPILKMINFSLYDLPVPPNINIWWNFGSLLALCLAIQTLTGIFLAMHYIPFTELAFSSIIHITHDVNSGWLLRNLHANCASMFFVCLYFHIARGLYYHSFYLRHTWLIGALLFILTMATAFFGYVLPWGQMSFWGATVITNLFSAIPYIGQTLVEWMWGGYAVDSATLTRFFVLHFALPFILWLFTAIHFLFLHQTGSSSPLGITSFYHLAPMQPYYILKDLTGFILFMAVLMYLSLLSPFLLGDPENFIPANPLLTPLHIQPEWYFLFVYAILRSIPNKLGGVITLVAALVVLFLLPFMALPIIKTNHFNPLGQILFWFIVTTFLLLTWIGMRPIEAPYDMLGAFFTCLYFVLFALLPLSLSLNVKLLLFS